MKAPARILVIRRRAIGDVLVSLDVPRALREAWPAARIGFVVDRAAEPVVRDLATIDELLVYERARISRGPLRTRLAATLDWLRSLRAFGADLVVDLLGTPQTAAWSRLSGAQIRVGPRRRGRTWAYNVHVAPETERRFAGERFLDWVRALGVEPGPWRPHAPGACQARAQRLDPRRDARPLVLLNPSATWSAKAWPTDSFGALAAGLEEIADVRVVWGPGEEEVRDRIVASAGGGAQALPPTDLVDLGAWLGHADLLITTDSGPKHLACAMGTPTLTLFGSTDPRGWQPDLAGHRWLTHPVECHPCNLTECPVPGHPCLDALAPETVAAAAREMLEGGRRDG